MFQNNFYFTDPNFAFRKLRIRINGNRSILETISGLLQRRRRTWSRNILRLEFFFYFRFFNFLCYLFFLTPNSIWFIEHQRKFFLFFSRFRFYVFFFPVRIHIFLFLIPAWLFFGFKYNKFNTGSSGSDLAWIFYISAVQPVKLRILNQTKIWIILVLRNLRERNLSLFSRKRFQSSTVGMKLFGLFVSLRCRSTVASGSLRWQQPMLRLCR